jgi:RNA polymerase sigma-70 factor (ECF subfamily)
VEGLLVLLQDEATFSMPPLPVWYQGRANVGGLVRKTVFSGAAVGRWRLLPTRANNRPAFGLFRRNDETGAHGFYGIQVVSLAGAGVADMTTFIGPGFGRWFGFGARLEQAGG